MSSRVGWLAIAGPPGARGFYQRYPRAVLRFVRGRVAVACAMGALAVSPALAAGGSFAIAVLPDTQNMIDYKHQRASGFPIDASDLFLAQMRWIAEHTVPR